MIERCLVLQNLPIMVIAIPMLAAFFIPILGRFSKRFTGYFAVFVLLITSSLVGLLAREVLLNGPITYTLGSATPTMFRIQLFVDGFSVFMAIIMAVVSLAACIYSLSNISKYTGQEKYYTLLLLVVVGSYGMVFTGDLFNLFVFFEISSISLCGLVAFKTNRGESFEAAFKYMLYSTITGVLMLMSIGILYGQYGLLNMAGISGAMTRAGGATLIDKIALGMLVTVFSLKAGSVPMHMPTPDAYGEAPAGITALFVASSQAGLYAVFRTGFTIYAPNLDPYSVGLVLIILGILSMFVGVTMALIQKDIKRLMAYHAISQTGYMLLGVGVGMAVLYDPVNLERYGLNAVRGGIFHIINHAMYKGLLFMTAGAIIYRTGTSNLNEMRGLGHHMKFTAVMFIIGAMAIAGLPPTNGFASKLMIYESTYHFSPVIAAVAMMVSVLTLASFVKVFYSAFLGPKPDKPVKDVPTSMKFGMLMLGSVVILFSLFPATVVSTIVDPAVQALIPVYVPTPVIPGSYSFTNTLITGDTTWNAAALIFAFLVCLIIVSAIRSMGNPSYAKREHVGKPYYFGNEIISTSRVTGSNVYWGFIRAMKRYYKPVTKEHTGNANDYVGWLVLALAAILVMVVVF